MAEYFVDKQPRPARYAARQPILAADETVIGYRLLFRTGVVDHFAWKEAEGTSRTAIEVSSLLGLNVLSDDRLAFISCSRDLLLERSVTFLPADKVVAGIGPDTLPDTEVEAACRDLKKAGYKIAFEGFAIDDPRESLIDLADFLAVDLRRTSWDHIQRITRIHGNQHTGLLAENVETRESFEDTLRAGFHYFQGYFFRKPEMISTAGIASNRILYLQLLQSVARPDLHWDEVEDLIKRDAALFYRLLRYLNSALFGIRGEVRTVNQALVLLGENELRRWCRLAGVFELSSGRPSDLILSALVRARLGELLQPHVEHTGADLFTVGLLSFMDAILQVPMSVVLNGLPLDPDSTAMLLDNEGPLLPFYRLVWAIESGAWGAVVRACDQLKLSEEYVAGCFSSAMGWAQSVSSGF